MLFIAMIDAAALAAVTAVAASFASASASAAAISGRYDAACAQARIVPYFCWSVSPCSVSSDDRLSRRSLA